MVFARPPNLFFQAAAWPPPPPAFPEAGAKVERIDDWQSAIDDLLGAGRAVWSGSKEWRVFFRGGVKGPQASMRRVSRPAVKNGPPLRTLRSPSGGDNVGGAGTGPPRMEGVSFASSSTHEWSRHVDGGRIPTPHYARPASKWRRRPTCPHSRREARFAKVGL